MSARWQKSGHRDRWLRVADIPKKNVVCALVLANLRKCVIDFPSTLHDFDQLLEKLLCYLILELSIISRI